MSKYIPPNMRGSITEPNMRGSIKESNTNQNNNSQRWKRDDLQEPGFLQPSLRHIRQSSSVTDVSDHLQQSSTVADVSEQMRNVKLDDFPALPMKKTEEFPALPLKKAVNKVATPQPIARATYASLASNWAEKAKENEEKETAKKEAEDELKKRQAKTDRKVIPMRQSVIAKTRKDSDDDVELDIGCHVSDESDHSDPSEVEYEVEDDEDDDEEEEDPDAFWTQRKHKGDIY